MDFNKENFLSNTNEKNLRVIIGATVLGLGGIRTHLILLCQLLRRQGIEVVVFATGSNWDGETIAGLKKIGVKFRMPPAFIRSSRMWSMLYCSLTWPLLFPRRASSLYCISPGYSQLLLHRIKPACILSINHEIVEPPSPESPAGKCAAGLDVSVANSRKVAQLMKNAWPHKPIRDIPFLTADAPTPSPVGRRRVKPDEPLRVVYLGRLVEQKRPDQLVRHWLELTEDGALKRAHLDIHGYDPEGRMLKGMRDFVGLSGIENQVTIHGEYRLADLPRILDAADLVVLPSLWEGLPLVLVEAMLKGVPFVATAAGGTEELGDNNPDVIVTSTGWRDFEAGLITMAEKIRAGAIDPVRLHAWTESRYGSISVSQKWLACLCHPREFFKRHD
jgi:glycosyltransferase involved in cell wall biosynthesis